MPHTPDRRWPIFATLAGYGAGDVKGDLAAGLTLVAISVPEQMATARLGGFPPEIGFLAFIAGAIGFAVFGTNRFLSVGADSTITPIFAGGLAMAAAAGSADHAAMAAALALGVGIVLVGAGLLRLGWIADLLSVPVTTGFLAGVSAHIVASQLPALLGVPAADGSLVHRLAVIAGELAGANLYCLALGLGVLALTFICERIGARIPGALIGLVLATAAVLLFGLQEHGVAVLNITGSAVPHFAWPAVSFADFTRILPLALIVSVVVMLQTAATTRSFVSDPGQAARVDRDFIGVGAGSLVAGLFGAFPVNASPPRTAIAAETGGRSQVAGVLAAVLIFLLAAFGAKLLALVPQTALAGVLLFIASRIFRVRIMAEVYRRSRAEFALIILTMLSIVALPIETGVGIGIVVSLLHGVWATVRVKPIEFEQVLGTSIWWAPTAKRPGSRLSEVAVVAFQAPLAFLNAHRFQEGLLELIERRSEPPKLIVLEASSLSSIDFTAAQILSEVIRHYQAAGVVFAVARLESVRAQDAVARFGIVDLLGEDRIFYSVDEAIRTLNGPPSA
jgi:MFS superfamily sulfate permease-like transporter